MLKNLLNTFQTLGAQKRIRLKQREPDLLHLLMALDRLQLETTLYHEIYRRSRSPVQRRDAVLRYGQKRHAQHALLMALFSRDYWAPGVRKGQGRV